MNLASPKRTRAFFASQPLTSREEQIAYRILHTIIFACLLASFAALAAMYFFPSTPQAITIVASMSVLLLITYILLRRRILFPARIMAPLVLYATIVSLMVVGSGIHDISMIALGGVIVLASFTLGNRGAFAFAGLIIAAEFIITLAEMNGILVTDASSLASLDDPFIVSIVILGIAYAQNILVVRLNLSLQDAQANEKAQIEVNHELIELKNALETRVMVRTAALERRTSQMEAISQVTQSITAVQDLAQLLPSICEVVSQQFGFYHTGIFLLDDRGEYAVLQAANSTGGQEMLKRGHRLRVGTTGIVGAAAGQGQTRVALDVGADSVYFNNPDLPDTRSEMALPLKLGSQVVGVLDVQSMEVNAFEEEDIAVLNILANQISIAIGNARLFSQTKQSLVDSQDIYQQFVEQDWARFSQTAKHTGYTYDGVRTTPLDNPVSPSRSNAINIPIKIRGLPIGSVIIQSANPLRAWSQGEINLAQAAAERAGLAVENHRLLVEAQRRASKERVIGEITARIGSSVDLREIMQTAVEEIGHALPDSDVTVQFSPENQ